MKNIIFAILLLVGVISCSEDLGNYDYSEVEKVVLGEFEKDAYVLLKGKELEIALELQLPEGRKTEDFNYLWVVNSEELPLSKLIKDTLSFELQLKEIITLPVGVYALQLQVKDPRTGIVWSQRTILRVIGSSEGWLFLEKDQEGNGELSMYAKDSTTGKYIYGHSMLESAGVPEELRKGPHSLISIAKATAKKGGYGVWIMTDGGVFMLDVDNAHAYDIENQPIDYMTTDLGVKPERIFSTNVGPSPNVFMFAQGQMYSSNLFDQISFGQNVALVQGYDFAPFVGSCPTNAMGNNMFFERSIKKFVTYNPWASSFFDVWGTPIGDELLFMDYRRPNSDPNPMNMNTSVYALMKSLTGDKVPIGEKYLLKWNLAFMSSTVMLAHTQPLLATTHLHLVADSKVAVPQQIDVPYLYYSDGNDQLYMTTGNSEREIIVEGGKLEGKIISLKTHMFFNTYPLDQFQEYVDFSKMIIVSTEKADGSGEVYFLSIPNTGSAHKLKLEDSVKTNAPVISIDFQEKASFLNV